MENNEAFAAETEAEVITQSMSSNKQDLQSKTPDAIIAALGQEQAEREPLLGQSQRESPNDNDSDAALSDVDRQKRLPWYKTPSVRPSDKVTFVSATDVV